MEPTRAERFEGAEQRGGGRRRVRRWALAGASVLGAAAAALAATSLLDSEVPGTGIVERAVAAVTHEDVIYHVVERARMNASYEPNGDTTRYIESWHTSDGRIHRTTYAVKDGGKGRLLEDFAGRRLPGRRVSPLLRWDAWTTPSARAGSAPVRTPGPRPSTSSGITARS